MALEVRSSNFQYIAYDNSAIRVLSEQVRGATMRVDLTPEGAIFKPSKKAEEQPRLARELGRAAISTSFRLDALRDSIPNEPSRIGKITVFEAR